MPNYGIMIIKCNAVINTVTGTVTGTESESPEISIDGMNS